MRDVDNNRRRIFDDIFDNFSMLVGKNYVTLYDSKMQLTRYSPGIVEMVGLPDEFVKDGVYDWSTHIHPEDRGRYEAAMAELIAGRKLTYDLNYRVRLKDGTYSMFRLVGGGIREGDDDYPSIIGGTMINEGLMDNTDRVTVMRNQNGFYDDLLDLDRGAHSYTVLLIGFGRLSHINEVYGYGYGNQLLKEVGRIVTESAVGRRCYRMEGSKFAVLAEDATMEEMNALYADIRRALKSGVEAEGVHHNLIACRRPSSLRSNTIMRSRGWATGSCATRWRTGGNFWTRTPTSASASTSRRAN